MVNSAADIIVEGLAYTVMGILIVFLILVIIMLVIKAMALFSSEKSVPEIKDNDAQIREDIQQENNDEELIAVITAAVAAVMDKAASDIVVHSYKKLPAEAWKNTGRRELLENRF